MDKKISTRFGTLSLIVIFLFALVLVTNSQKQSQCPLRNIAAAGRAGRSCRPKDCRLHRNCKSPRICLCDYECGYSCINLNNTCPDPEPIPNMERIEVTRKLENGSFAIVTSPYKYNDKALYVCEAGYRREWPYVEHYCHGRRDWTGTTVCARACQSFSYSKVIINGMTCTKACKIDRDCESSRLMCLCDGPCGRRCVDPDVNCGSPPPTRNANVTVSGTGFFATARYTCNRGYFMERGYSVRKCTAGDTWDGEMVVCQRITCGDPSTAIQAMGGYIVRGRAPRYFVNRRITLSCRPFHRMLGSRTRTCLPSGRWSGVDTVCDFRDTRRRCSHPGVPINGAAVIGRGFVVGRTVRFTCNEGYSLIGERQQECLYFLQWSGGGAPQCINPKFQEVPSSISELQQSLEIVDSLKRTPRLALALSTAENITDFNEVYIVIDLSDDVRDDVVKDTLRFAENQVERISSSGYISSCVIVYASSASVRLALKRRLSAEVIKSLRNIIVDRQNIVQRIGSRRNLKAVLVSLNETLDTSATQGTARNRLIFFNVNGRQMEGGDAQEVIESIKLAHQSNLPEIYVVTYGDGLSQSRTFDELQQLSASLGNFIPNPDVSQFTTNRSQTQDQDDYRCGEAGRVGNVKKLAVVSRVLGGTQAFRRAWPWYVAVTLNTPGARLSVENTYRSITGGGSLISDKWVLTAAHIFDDARELPEWKKRFLFTFGLTRRPEKDVSTLPPYVKIFGAEEIRIHPQYRRLPLNLDYDIALVRIGSQYAHNGSSWYALDEGKRISFSDHIKPVCLPCMEGNCVQEYLRKPSVALLTGRESKARRCEIEGDWLLQNDDREEKDIFAVVIGFGETRNVSFGFIGIEKSSDYLKQAPIKLLSNQRCSRARNTLLSDGLPQTVQFTQRMTCGISGSKAQISDACRGDSGGPFTREVFDKETGKKTWIQIGIVSWGFGCGQSYTRNGSSFLIPAYYTNVVSLAPWITRIISTAWTPWRPIGSCSVSCGSGTVRQTRTCMNGPGCEGGRFRMFACNTTPCRRSSGWSQWSASGVCTRSCGSGTILQRRSCLNGNGCFGRRQRTSVCNTQACPRPVAEWGTWVQVTPCSQSCGEGRRIERRACNNGPGCVGARSRDIACNAAACPAWSPWEVEGDCSVTCGGGRRRETRTCLNGEACDGANFRTVDCNDQACPLWSQWEAEGDCSVTCGGGRRRETRTCLNGEACEGANFRTVDCNDQACPLWSRWESEGDCSVTCGGGRRRETRTCLNGEACDGANFRTVDCNVQPCPAWSRWEAEGSCSVTCGGGRRRETRTCLNGEACDGPNFRTVDCNTPACPSWSQWESEGSCSVTCGGGRRRETRTCLNGEACDGANFRTVDCNDQPCPAWSPWEAEGSCSVTCGGGRRRETRICLNGEACDGPNFRTVDCNDQPCPVWSPWEEAGGCSSTCGGGRRRETRRCVDGSTCVGPTTRTVSCNNRACPSWTSWSEDGECSRTCGGGSRRESRTCRNGPCEGATVRSVNCGLQPCPQWSSWSLWSLCDVTCGNGKQIRVRQCVDDNTCVGERTSERNCVASANCSCRTDNSCMDYHASFCETHVKASHCSSNRWFTENCRKTCNICSPCLPSCECSEWRRSGICSVTCGGGTINEVRTCRDATGCDEPTSRETQCNTQPCPTWGSWSRVGLCDVTCGEGRLLERRSCLNGPGCVGSGNRFVACNNDIPCPVWSSWSPVGGCSVSCGEGILQETRACLTRTRCPGLSRRTTECNTQLCPMWSSWTATGRCSVTCGNGVRSERRTCRNGPRCAGPRIREVSCSATPCPSPAANTYLWSPWGGWGSCSESCGRGIQTRRRVCLVVVCDGSSFEDRNCNDGNCALSQVTSWTPWGSCSVTCGGGVRRRDRSCINSPICGDSTTEEETCNSRRCRSLSENLRCFVGRKIDIFPIKNDSLTPRECQLGYICSVSQFLILGSVNSAAHSGIPYLGILTEGECVRDTICNSIVCEDSLVSEFNDLVASYGFPSIRINSCSRRCCEENLCNRALIPTPSPKSVSRGAGGNCGGEVVASFTPQAISSSSFSSNAYDDNLHCVWIIRTNSSESDVQIHLQFDDNFHTEPCCDPVQVRFGNTSSAPSDKPMRGRNDIGRYYVSYNGYLHITFDSDDSVSFNGFLFTYSQSMTDLKGDYSDARLNIDINDLGFTVNCGRNLIADEEVKEFSSPNFPLDYERYSYCTWNITAPPGSIVWLRIITLSTETCCDLIEARDGTDDDAPILAIWSGSFTFQPTVFSTGPQMLVRFRSNADTEYTGFLAQYRVAAQSEAHPAQTYPIIDCGGNITIPSTGFEEISSPGFPGVYRPEASCRWTVTSPEESQIRLWFNYIQTEGCCDWIVVRDGPTPTSQKLGALSGSSDVFHNFISSRNSLTVEFASDISSNDQGFHAYLEILSSATEESTCGGNLMATPDWQYFSTPNWPNNYSDSVNCIWVLRSRAGQTIQVKMLGIITEKFLDEIKVFEGLSTTRAPLATLSGKLYELPTYESGSNDITVVFTSDESITFGGFRARYRLT